MFRITPFVCILGEVNISYIFCFIFRDLLTFSMCTKSHYWVSNLRFAQSNLSNPIWYTRADKRSKLQQDIFYRGSMYTKSHYWVSNLRFAQSDFKCFLRQSNIETSLIDEMINFDLIRFQCFVFCLTRRCWEFDKSPQTMRVYFSTCRFVGFCCPVIQVHTLMSCPFIGPKIIFGLFQNSLG